MHQDRINATRKTIANPKLRNAAARRAKVGIADQMGYQRDERIERQALVNRIAGERKETKDAAEAARKKVVKRRAGETGSSAGTMGGSRRTIIRAMLGR